MSSKTVIPFIHDHIWNRKFIVRVPFNLRETKLGEMNHVKYTGTQAGSGNQYIIRDIRINVTFNNDSTSAVDFYAVAHLFQFIQSIDFQLNQSNIQLIPQFDKMNYFREWMLNLMRDSKDMQDFQHKYWEQTHNPNANFLSMAGVQFLADQVHGTNSMERSYSLRTFFPNVVDVPMPWIQELYLEFRFRSANGLAGAFTNLIDTNGAVTGIANHFRTSNWTLFLELERHSNPPISDKLHLLSKDYLVHNEPNVFQNSTEYTIDFDRLFSRKRVQYCRLEVVQDADADRWVKHGWFRNNVTGLEFLHNGVTIFEMIGNDHIKRFHDEQWYKRYGRSPPAHKGSTLEGQFHDYIIDLAYITGYLDSATADKNHVIATSVLLDQPIQIKIKLGAVLAPAHNLRIIMESDRLIELKAGDRRNIKVVEI